MTKTGDGGGEGADINGNVGEKLNDKDFFPKKKKKNISDILVIEAALPRIFIKKKELGKSIYEITLCSMQCGCRLA